MNPVGDGPTQALIAKLERRDTLSAIEKDALNAILAPPQFHAAGSLIIQAGVWPDTSSLLISGLAARISGHRDGARSVTQLSVAGDFLDLHSLVMKQIDHGVLAISDCITAPVPHPRLVEMIESHPHLGRLFWLETAIDGALQREWFHRLGRQTAFQRMAHLFCELHARLGVVGLSDDEGFNLTLTQGDLANCLGLSAVHVNRVLKDLRQAGLIDWRGARVVVLNKPRLCETAEFDPTYLRLHSAPV